jgi:hypothetical protein
MRVLCLLLPLMAAAAPAASGFDLLHPNVLVGVGLVGPAQYHQGRLKWAGTVNATGFVEVGDSLSFGGLGVAIRSTSKLGRSVFEHKNFDEFGLAVPFVTFRSGHAVAQLGVEIQRINLQKNFYYLAFGFHFGRKTQARE